MVNEIAQQIKDVIPMWAWARLADADLREYTSMPEGSTVLLHTDHFHLDIIWQYPDGDIQHEQAYYDVALEYDSVADFLDSEIGGDAWQTWEYQTGLANIIDNMHGTEVDIDALPIVSFLPSKAEQPVSDETETINEQVEQREQTEYHEPYQYWADISELHDSSTLLGDLVKTHHSNIGYPALTQKLVLADNAVKSAIEAMQEVIDSLNNADAQDDKWYFNPIGDERALEPEGHFITVESDDGLQELATIEALYYLTNIRDDGKRYTKIDAIKAWREVTRDKLRDAKNAVEDIMEWLKG